MNVLSLFTGIGGFDLACDALGWTIVAQVEIDPFCQTILRRHWPDTPLFSDIRALTAHTLKENALVAPDLIIGGVPCQPSAAPGKHAGSDDPRWLWPHALRLTADLRPRWCVWENPRGILSVRNGDGEYEFPRLVQALHDLGYAVAWCCFPASVPSIAAPHKRERVFIVGHAQESSLRPGLCPHEPSPLGRRRPGHPNGTALPDQGPSRFRQPVPGLDGDVDGLPRGLDRRAFTGASYRLDTPLWPASPDAAQHADEPAHLVTACADRLTRLRCLGNAVVPAQAYAVLRTIAEQEAR